MTPEKQARLRELPTLIANEDDPDTLKNLALEFQRLLDEEAAERDLDTEQGSTRFLLEVRRFRNFRFVEFALNLRAHKRQKRDRPMPSATSR